MAAVEFALVASVFFMMLFGALEFSRLLWTWNAASEATRYGARLAAVCDRTASDQTFIKTRMRTRLSSLSDSHISITYQPAGCNATTTPPICQSVTVATTGVRFQTLIP
ncbi:MAG: TadE family protein, partial [Rhizobacter sp.]